MSNMMYHKRFDVGSSDGGVMDTYIMPLAEEFDTVQVRNVPVDGSVPVAARLEFPLAIQQWDVVVPDSAAFFSELERRGYTGYHL